MTQPQDPPQLLKIASDYEYLALDVAALAQQAKLKRYGYGIGGLGLLVPENTLSEVLSQFVVYPLPNTKVWLRGLVNLRGNVLPVYDLAQLFQLSVNSKEAKNLLILDRGSEAVGLLVEQLPVACNVDEWQRTENILNIPDLLNEYITEAYIDDNKLWIGFDHNAFFNYVKDNVVM